MRPNNGDLNKEGPLMEVDQPPLRTPSVTVNLIKAVRDHGVHAIAELDEQIEELDERRARLVAERETISKLVDIATSHKDHVQRN